MAQTETLTPWSPVWAKKLKYKYPIKAIAIYIEQQLFERSFRSLSAFDIQDNKGGEDLSSNNEMFHKMAKSGNCQVLKANNNQNVNIWDKAQRKGVLLLPSNVAWDCKFTQSNHLKQFILVINTRILQN